MKEFTITKAEEGQTLSSTFANSCPRLRQAYSTKASARKISHGTIKNAREKKFSGKKTI